MSRNGRARPRVPRAPRRSWILAAALRTGIPSVRHPERACEPSWHTAWPVRGAAPAAHRVRTHDRCRSHDATCTARPALVGAAACGVRSPTASGDVGPAASAGMRETGEDGVQQRVCQLNGSGTEEVVGPACPVRVTGSSL